MSNEKFMKAVIKEAANAIKEKQKPIAACIVKNGRIVAMGHNTVLADDKVAAHAEINAINSLCKKLGKRSLYKALAGYALFSTLEPCNMCFGACEYAGITKVVYGASDEDMVRFETDKRLNSSSKAIKDKRNGVSIVEGLMRDECLRLFEQYRSKVKMPILFLASERGAKMQGRRKRKT